MQQSVLKIVRFYFYISVIFGYVESLVYDWCNIFFYYSVPEAFFEGRKKPEFLFWLDCFSSMTIVALQPLKNRCQLFQFYPFLVFIQCLQCHHVFSFALFVCEESCQENSVTIFALLSNFLFFILLENAFYKQWRNYFCFGYCCSAY